MKVKASEKNIGDKIDIFINWLFLIDIINNLKKTLFDKTDFIAQFNKRR